MRPLEGVGNHPPQEVQVAGPDGKPLGGLTGPVPCVRLDGDGSVSASGHGPELVRPLMHISEFIVDALVPSEEVSDGS